MRTLPLAAALVLGVGACSDYDQDNASYAEGANATYDEANATGTGYAEGTRMASAWPEGARIVVEEGVTYRIDPGGARVRLGPGDSRIVVEDGVSYRVDPDGTRIRIDPSGVAVRIDGDVDADDARLEVNTQ